MKHLFFKSALTLLLTTSATTFSFENSVTFSNFPEKVNTADKATLTNDLAKIASSYGFVSRLPKDVEGFYVTYRLHESWIAFANSQWANTFISLEKIKNQPFFQEISNEWKSSEGLKIRELLESTLGQEIMIVLPAGCGEQLSTIVRASKKLDILGVRIDLTERLNPSSELESYLQIFQDAMPELLPALKECELPPLLIISKAIKSKSDLEAGIKNVIETVEKLLSIKLKKGTFKVAEKYEFNYVRASTRDLLSEELESFLEFLSDDDTDETLAMEMDAAVEDVAADRKLTENVNTAETPGIIDKNIEIAWGWIDDYLVLSLGKDSRHIKIAENISDSALSIPEISLRTVQFSEKKPTDLVYVSKKLYGENLEIESFTQTANRFSALLEQLSVAIKPEQMQEMHNLAQKFEDRFKALFPKKYDSSVGVGYLEKGFHYESFGGSRLMMCEGSQSLRFANLTLPSAFIVLNWRQSNGPEKMANFIEEAAVSVWHWLEQNESSIPLFKHPQFILLKAQILPNLKNLWSANCKLSHALGSEKAIIVDLNGDLQGIQGVPPFFTNGKIPRFSYVSELKDRKGVSEAWDTLGTSELSSSALLLGNLMHKYSKQMKMEGETELYYLSFAESFKDAMPHFGISKDLWWLGTSPDLSKEMVVSPDKSGQPLAMDFKINFSLLWNYATQWLKILNENSNHINTPDEAKQFQETGLILDFTLNLARSIQSLEMKVSDEKGQTQTSIYLKYQDIQ